MKGKILICIGVALIAIGIGGIKMAHDRANLVCDDMCLVEGIPKENIAVITGNITVNEEGTANLRLDYPTGFNKDNCVVISAMLYNVDTMNVWTIGLLGNTSNNLYKFIPEIELGTKIAIGLSDTNQTSKTVPYKIVLMKIA